MLIFGGALLGAYLLLCAFDPWVDCGWCKGAPKQRSSGASMAVALGIGVVLLCGWLGLPAGPALVGVLVLWLASSISSSRSYHFCSVPWWLGGCGGRGRRRRLGSLLIGIGLGRLE